MLHQQPVPLSYKGSFDSTIPFANEWDASAQDDTRDGIRFLIFATTLGGTRPARYRLWSPDRISPKRGPP